MKKATITYIIDTAAQAVLLAEKARNTGEGFLFGYGGKINWWEMPRGNAQREIWEETGGKKRLRINPLDRGGIWIRKKDLEPFALIDFYNGADVRFGNPSFRVLWYKARKYNGVAIDTVEMRYPQWHPLSSLETLDKEGKLKPGDILILREMLKGNCIKGWMRFDKKTNEVLGYEINPCHPRDVGIKRMFPLFRKAS
jgi:hypothetical protein